MIDYKKIFEQLPIKAVLYDVDDNFTILDITDTHLKGLGRTIESILNLPLIEAFPINDIGWNKETLATLKDSFRECIKWKKPSKNPILRYDIPGENGEMTILYWSIDNFPVIIDDEVKYILLVAVDVSGLFSHISR